MLVAMLKCIRRWRQRLDAARCHYRWRSGWLDGGRGACCRPGRFPECYDQRNSGWSFGRDVYKRQLGVRLGSPIADGVEVSDRAELGLGDLADVDFMQSAVGLVWRATVLWMLLLFLLGLASLVG